MTKKLKDYFSIDLIGKRFIDKNNRLEHYILEKNGVREYRVLSIEGRRDISPLHTSRDKYKYLESKITSIHLFIEYETPHGETDTIHTNVNDHLNDELIKE